MPNFKYVYMLFKALCLRMSWRNTIVAALSLYKRQGFNGVIYRIKFIILNRNNYQIWISSFDCLTVKHRIEMHNKPLISIIMPTFNSQPEQLSAAVESIQNQIYTNWELCIADDLSTDPRIRTLLEQYVKNDSRIKVVFRNKNGHISAASNSALSLATGKWVALMDHDDLLPQHALFWLVDSINRNPNARMFYSDEDKIDVYGNRHSPYFKCDWNPELFHSHNMFCHLGVYERTLINCAGGFRLGVEGAQDYDLTLRCSEIVDDAQICHIPRVLYHWRAHNGSMAQSTRVKPYAISAGKRALHDHFNRLNINATVKLTNYGYRVQYSLPVMPPLVSLVIPTRNGLDLIRTCIESIIEMTSYPNYEIIIVDNGSDDVNVLNYFESLLSEKRIRIYHDDRPFNYSQLNNSAVDMAEGELICLLNNDIEVITPDWLTEMVSIALRPGVGAVGAKLRYANDTVQHGGVVLGVGGVAGHAFRGLPIEYSGYFHRLELTSAYSAVTAACLVIKKSLYKQVGGLNEIDLKVAFNDVDFCLRIRKKGYRNVWTPYAELYHHESATRGYDNTPEKQKRFNSEVEYMRENWRVELENDTMYSPNLTLDFEDFSYAWPPRI